MSSIAVSFLKADGSSTALGFELAQSLLVQISTLFSIGKLSLCLTELGQVEGSNLLGFFNLLLVGLDLGLELINQSLHALVVLAVLIRGIGQFLDTPLRLAQVLLSIATPAALGINFRFKFADPCLHLVHGLLASLESVGLSFIQTGLHVFDLALVEFAVPFKYLSKLLFGPELIG